MHTREQLLSSLQSVEPLLAMAGSAEVAAWSAQEWTGVRTSAHLRWSCKSRCQGGGTREAEQWAGRCYPPDSRMRPVPRS